MDDSKTGLDDLKQIRAVMERCSTFLSLSGFAGVIVGIIAIAASFAIVRLCNSYLLTTEVLQGIQSGETLRNQLVLVFIATLLLSVASAFIFSLRKAKRKTLPIFNKVSLSFATHFFIPLIVGGLFIIGLASKNYYDLVLPSMLIFYGISLLSASKYTLPEISFLGIGSLGLGLFAVFFVSYALLLWAAGFGICTIGYGLFIYSKYEK